MGKRSELTARERRDAVLALLRRPHWALIPEGGGDPLVPLEVYQGDRAVRIPRWQTWVKGAKEKLDRMLAKPAAGLSGSLFT